MNQQKVLILTIRVNKKMFAMEWEYLTGRAVAREYHGGHNNSVPEWPPHPERVFQALVAAWGTLGEPETHSKALFWLETQDPPFIYAPDIPDDQIPFAPDTYVPVNDVPEMVCNKRQDRTFPSVLLPEISGKKATCALIWPEAVLDDNLFEVFVQLCFAVTHIGHSRSLVRLKVALEPQSPNWMPSTSIEADAFFRVPLKGRFETLRSSFSKGEHPPVARYQAYVRTPSTSDLRFSGEFDDHLIIFRKITGDSMLLGSTLAFTGALRGSILSKIEEGSLELVSGHGGDGAPTEKTHIAYVPLPFVGDKHADGHILGFALVLPKHVSYTEKNSVWKAIVSALDPETETLRLVAGNSGTCLLVPEERLEPPLGLRKKTWCARARRWGSATPFVLDRMPPRRHSDFDGWSARQIADACERQGLPIPEEISISEVSSLRGVPHAREFPPLLRKDGLKRWHTHVEITFPVPIEGPLLLGAGRFRGYGLFKPVFSKREVE